jgi:nicotinate-nucleotide pyrophosphorylase (carboxylating)
MNYLTEESLREFIQSALREDVGDGDHTTLASIPADARGTALLHVKDNGYIAGMDMAERIFHFIEPEARISALKKDGDKISKGEIAFKIEAKIHTILTGERLVLNCMQRMSGIATHTRHLTDLISHTNTRLLDTRKTTPNFRIMEKWAVVIGGGVNHRYGLFDMILLKDNHVDYAGGIDKAINKAKEYIASTGRNLKIEIETRNLKEVELALKTGGIFRIMLDNMDTSTLKEAVKLINRQVETEASGGITEHSIVSIAETGVDYISVGALTHSVKSLDLSLKAEKEI